MFRFLHASDLHIAQRPEGVGITDVRTAGLRRGLKNLAMASSYEIGLADALVRLAGVLADGADPLDGVLLSGDVATTGGAKDLARAHEFVDGAPGTDLFRARETLRSCGKPRLLIPGNHDRFDPPHFDPGGTQFDAVFGGFWSAGQGAQLLWQGTRDGQTLAIVGADLTLRDAGDASVPAFGQLGQGRANTAVIEALVQETETLRAASPEAGVVWVVHFPPDFRELSPVLELVDSSRLVNAAVASGVEHVIAGHTHEPRIYDCRAADGRSVRILCAGTATQAISASGHFAHLLEISVLAEGRTSISRLDFRFETDEGEFMPAREF